MSCQHGHEGLKNGQKLVGKWWECLLLSSSFHPYAAEPWNIDFQDPMMRNVENIKIGCVKKTLEDFSTPLPLK